MQEKTEAISEFALEKTIKQQREYLPVFAVRQKMMSVIRENNVVIIVGETGMFTNLNFKNSIINCNKICTFKNAFLIIKIPSLKHLF